MRRKSRCDGVSPLATFVRVVTLLTRMFTESEAREAASWQYPPPFDFYNDDPDDSAHFLARTAHGEGYYPAVDERGAIVAFCVLGREARVPGQTVLDGTLDIGAGVRPDRTSRGVGTALLGQVIELARTSHAPAMLRTAVASFNDRSLALCRRAGFRAVRTFAGPGGVEFQELTRSCGSPV